MSRFPLFAAAALLSLVACQKPEPPRVTPKEAKVVAIGPQGLDIAIKVEVLNPNRANLTVQSFTGKAKLDGKYDMGTVTVAKAVTLPSNAPIVIDVPMTMPWQDVKVLAAIASAQRPVPYSVEGSAKVGGENLNIDVPFAASGTITREQLAAAAVKSIPTIPGLTP